MDWKYKHFHQQRSFSTSAADVSTAARLVMTESLGWELKETPDGFTAQGYSFGHAAIANLHIRSEAGGATVYVELLVARAGLAGFMLFDVGGYYNIQIGHWLDGIQGVLHQKLTDSQGTSNIPAPPARNKSTACLFNGCLMFIAVTIGLWFLLTLISAVIGLLTGTLYLWGRGGTLVAHGVWARAISALILLFAAWIVWRIKKRPRTRSLVQ